MTHTGADMHTMTLEKGLATFLNALSGKNRSGATIRAYQTDISQFIAFLHANNVSILAPADVQKLDVMEYLSSCAKRELTHLRTTDIDFIKPSITVRGKGSVEREIALEKKGIHALKSYLSVRPESLSSRLFLNYQGEPISERGIRKLVVKYRKEAGITKKASCHTLRHTFATCKAEKGVPAYQLQQWLGHANLNTTQIYIHLGKQNARKMMEDTSLP